MHRVNRYNDNRPEPSWRPSSPVVDRSEPAKVSPAKDRLRAIAPVVMVLMLLVVSAFAVNWGASGGEKPRISYVSHAYISIVGDVQLASVAAAESWPGTGSPGNPYVIDGYDVNGAAHACAIYIQDTTSYLTIQNCYAHDANTAGIQLTNVIHASLIGDVCKLNHLYGIYLDNSPGNNVQNCDASSNVNTGILVSFSGLTQVTYSNFSSNGGSGIYSQSSENLTIIHNICNSDTSYGVYLYAAANSVISNNTCVGDNNGIYVSSSSKNVIEYNTCTGGSNGIYMRYADSNILTGNNCSSSGTGFFARNSVSNIVQLCSFWYNSGYGAMLDTGTSVNRIMNNTFAYNNGATTIYDPTYRQAYDGVGTNYWNTAGSPHGYGNCWLDWNTPDDNHDGIVDRPYVLDGLIGVQDNYPLVYQGPSPIPEFGTRGLLLSVFAMLASVLILSRRIKF